MTTRAGAGLDQDSAESDSAQLDSAQLDSAVAALSDAADVTLFAHVNPDADALGSALALGIALHRRGSRVRVSFATPEHVPASLRELDEYGLVVAAHEVPAVPPTLVVLDTGSLQRVGSLGDRVQATIDSGGDVVVIDHHVANTRYGTRHLIDDSAEATAMIVLRLLDALDADVDLPIARCLYAGLVTDTRSFRHASARTHHVAARLLGAGVEPDRVARSVMDTHPFEWLGMLSAVLGDARLDPGSANGLGLVHATIGLELSDGLGADDLDGVVDIVRSTSQAEVAAVLKELRPGEWSVSLRSESQVDVSVAAAECGGGGHRRAAGFTACGKPDEILAALRAALAEAPLL